MITAGVVAMTVAALGYVLWPLVAGGRGPTPRLPLEQLEAPPREDQRDHGGSDA